MKLSSPRLVPTDILLITVTLACMGFALLLIAIYGRNIPLAEDWTMVPALTGNEPHFWQWLWSQNNEHRVPLPRALYLMLLTIAGGDFRVGMVFNVFLLGILALAMLWTIRYLRGGRSKLVDLFFPLILLHIGNDANLFWGWQLSFVVPVFLIFGVLLIILLDSSISSSASALFTGISMILLPLCGAIGLVFIPFLSCWLSFSSINHLRRRENLLFGGGLILAVLTATSISILYFVGYERPSWNPPSPGIGETLKTSAQFIALGWGPIAKYSWPIFIFLTFGLFAITIVLLLSSIYKMRDSDWKRSLFLLLFSGNLLLFSLAMGQGRAGLVPTVGLPTRYILLAAIAFLTAFFIWELYGNSECLVQKLMCLTMLILLPLNTFLGYHSWLSWYNQGMSLLETDISENLSSEMLAEKHNEFLAHWVEPNQLASYMEMLRLCTRSPFSKN